MKHLTTHRILSWLDENLLVICAAVLLAFIPLYPKLPLFDIIPGYLVRVRIEDFAVLCTLLIWFVQVLRKKIAWNTPLTIPIGLYAVSGLLSTISAVVISHTVPAQLLHIGKTSLHYLRYLEYFSIYFVLVSAIKTKRQFQIVLGVMVVTLLAVTIYGIGQKYYYWPVYSTMNREFAKGIRLILTEHARVQSTFGGHYDLGGYLVLVLPLILSLIAVAKKWYRAALIVAYLGGIWLMFVSASRSSLIAYITASVIVLGWQALKQSGRKRQLTSFMTLSAMVLFDHLVFLRFFGDDLFQRVEQTINSFPVLAQPYKKTTAFVDQEWTAVIGASQHTINAIFTRPGEQQATDALAAALKAEKPSNALTVDQVLVASDTRPVPAETGNPARPADVYVDIPVYTQIATTSADGTVTYSVIEKPRVYSENALTKGLSLAIRLDTLWPRAIAGFYINPLLGSGYATLTKETAIQFTEAESTDNNFLRTLGETGAFGFVTFYGVIIFSLIAGWRIIRSDKATPLEMSFAIGFIASTIGLLINAGFIDVFAASKIAFYYWSLTGILFALYLMVRQPTTAAGQGAPPPDQAPVANPIRVKKSGKIHR